MRTDQLDLFAEQDAAEAEIAREEYAINGWKTERHGVPLLPLFADVDPYGPAVWDKVDREWVAEHGNFDCLARCHVWRVPGGDPLGRLSGARVEELLGGACRPGHMRLSIGCNDFTHDRGNRGWRDRLHPGKPYRMNRAKERDAAAGLEHRWNADGCYCVTAEVNRGVCFGCGWSGPIRADWEGGGHVAVEDAHDHAFPGWRELPVVPKRPQESETSQAGRKAMQRWYETVSAAYPEGWLESGGPIRTDRGPIGSLGTRHVPGATGWGGYDLSATPIDAQLTPAQREEVAIYDQLIEEQWAFDRARRVAKAQAELDERNARAREEEAARV
jgi:hypothetical protein